MNQLNPHSDYIQSNSSHIDTLNDDKDNSVDNTRPRVIDIYKAIIVSDVRIGYEKSNASAFVDFLSDCISRGTSKEYSLFILGDLWDLWRKHDIIYSKESDDILYMINQFKEVYYLPGNHDYIVLDAA